jgi:hypothetical protein
VIVGIATDSSLVPDPEAIVAAFHAELDYLRNWGRPPRSTHAMAQDGVSAEIEKSERHRCQALTKAGQQCKNLARPGLETCWIHD